MTNTNWRNATQREDKKDWQELARVTRLVQPENNALNRKKLDQWLTKAITKNKSLSSDASRSRNTNDFWFHKGKIEALAELRLELRESTYVLESEKKAQKEEAPTMDGKNLAPSHRYLLRHNTKQIPVVYNGWGLWAECGGKEGQKMHAFTRLDTGDWVFKNRADALSRHYDGCVLGPPGTCGCQKRLDRVGREPD